jgi:DNA ligase-associated metallophosphoesterase
LEVECAGEKLLLSESKIIYWPKKKIVFIADLHLGKSTHFRKSGIAVPKDIIKSDLDRIKKVIQKFQPKKIFFLGDLFHSDLNHEWGIFDDFVQSNPSISFILIKGNHDILHDKFYIQTKLTIELEPFKLGSFILSHHPLPPEEIKEGQVNLCGHLHPGITLKGKGRSYLKLACFYKEERQLILPAFGRFTGLATVKQKTNSQVFVVLEASVKKIGN